MQRKRAELVFTVDIMKIKKIFSLALIGFWDSEQDNHCFLTCQLGVVPGCTDEWRPGGCGRRKMK